MQNFKLILILKIHNQQILGTWFIAQGHYYYNNSNYFLLLLLLQTFLEFYRNT